MPTADKRKAKKLWQAEDTFATCLFVMAIDTLDTEFFNWADEALRLELAETFNATIPQSSFDRLQAAVKIVTTDTFTRSEASFVDFCHILSGEIYDPALGWAPNDCMELAWGLTEGTIIWWLTYGEPLEDFSLAIRHYIGHVLELEGILHPPDVLKIGLIDQRSSGITDDAQTHPELAEAIHHNDQIKTQAIEETLRDRLHSLMEQLGTLPLTNARAGNFVAQLRRGMSGLAA